jgi:protein-tyrosine-phosphatase
MTDSTTERRFAKAQEALEEEFDGIHDHDTISRVMDDSRARLNDATLADFVPTLTYRLARERLRAIARAAGKLPRDRPEILFVGLEGRGRSQMAAGLANLRSDGKVFAHPVGTHARIELDPNVVEVMNEVGVDLQDSYPVPLTEEVLEAADVVVTLGRSVGDVHVPDGVRHEDWRIGDPVGAPVVEVRHIRDDLDQRVCELLAEVVPAPEPEESSDV